MHTYRELNRVTYLLTKMYYQERMKIIGQDYGTKFFYVENGNLSLYLKNGNLFLTWI